MEDAQDEYLGDEFDQQMLSSVLDQLDLEMKPAGDDLAQMLAQPPASHALRSVPSLGGSMWAPAPVRPSGSMGAPLPQGGVPPQVMSAAELESSLRNAEDREKDGKLEENDEEEDEEDEDRPRKSYFKRVYVPLPKERYHYMSHSEIAMMLRHQLQQLQTKNPMDDDFYYQVYTARQGGPWNGIGFPGIEVTGPQKRNDFRNEDGSPKLPEGTLGKIAVASVRKPRGLISISAPAAGSADENPSSSDDARKFMFAAHSLSYVIEEGLRCVMDIEDVENLLDANPTSAEEASQQRLLNERRSSLNQRLLEHMGLDKHRLGDYSPDHLVVQYAALAKGRNLILRSIMLLPPSHVLPLLALVVRRLDLFALPSDPTGTDLKMPIIIQQQLEKSLPHIVTEFFAAFLQCTEDSSLVKLLQTRAGSNLTLSFLAKGHELRCNPHAPPEFVSKWLMIYTRFFELFAPVMNQLFDETIPETLGPNVSQAHLNIPEETRWRLIADSCSHASPDQLKLIPTTGNLWPRLEIARTQYGPANYFASLAASALPTTLSS